MATRGHPRASLGGLLSPQVRATWMALFMLSYLIGSVAQPLSAVRAQINLGATLTVLRGSVGVLRADGTPISPARVRPPPSASRASSALPSTASSP